MCATCLKEPTNVPILIFTGETEDAIWRILVSVPDLVSLPPWFINQLIASISAPALYVCHFACASSSVSAAITINNT